MAGSLTGMQSYRRMARLAVDNSEAGTGPHKDSRPKETCRELLCQRGNTPSREDNRT
jgi:hypothetical protein